MESDAFKNRFSSPEDHKYLLNRITRSIFLSFSYIHKINIKNERKGNEIFSCYFVGVSFTGFPCDS